MQVHRPQRGTRSRGFTLVELLVVIALAGIIATIGLTQLGGARAKAHDAQRKSDLDQISRALLLYHDDTGTYPDNRNDNGPGSYECGNPSIAGGVFLSALDQDYLTRVPLDPVASAAQPCSYRYKKMSDTAYQLVANLESKTASRLCTSSGTFCNSADDRCWCVEP